jgi:sugar phosphate isomerase/epimerase
MGLKTWFVSIGSVIFILSIGLTEDNSRIISDPTGKYNNVKIDEIPFAVQCWTFRNFSFFETLENVEQLGIKYIQAYSNQRLSKDLPGSVTFGPGMTEEQIQLVKTKLRQHGISIFAMGVVRWENNETDAEKYFDFARNMGISMLVTEPEYDDFSLIENMVKKYNIRVAIHNHPIPTKYARPETILFRIKNLDRRIGVCADTGHWLRSGVIPAEALSVLEGRIFDIHLKDLNKYGKLEAEDVPFGTGVANVKDILAELTLQNYTGFLTIEHEKKADINNPSPPIKQGMQTVQKMMYYRNYTRLLKLDRARGTFNKHGWNHYGPGYFELDEYSGILKSQGGMGLLWFAEKKYKDFIIELDYKCSQMNTNSGVFIRIPEVPVNNNYINHSFEIQIDDSEQGIHITGSAYDAEGPQPEIIQSAIKPTGEWNHFKISFIGEVIEVELNGIEVLNWKAEPRGKIRNFVSEGYIGLQNHDSRSPIYFKNIYLKEL